MARLARVAGRSVGLLLSLAGIAFVAVVLAREWPRSRAVLWGADGGPVVLALVVGAAGMLAVALGWRRAIRLVGGDLPLSRAVSLYFRGEVAKYVPGGVWAVVGRAELARRAGLPPAAAYGGVALSLGALYLAAASVAAATWPLASTAPGPWTLGLVVLPLGVAALHPRVLAAGFRFVERVTRRELGLRPPPWRSSLGLVVRYVVPWVAIGTATWLVAVASGADAGWLRITFATSSSWLVGFLVVPAPGGVGVREATFVATSGMPAGAAAAVAIASRLLFVAIDAGGALIATAVVRRAPRASVAGGTDRPDAP